MIEIINFLPNHLGVKYPKALLVSDPFYPFLLTKTHFLPLWRSLLSFPNNIPKVIGSPSSIGDRVFFLRF